MLTIRKLDPDLSDNDTMELLGLIPLFLDEEDPDPAADQIDKHYQHGGGWRSFNGFERDPADNSIQYPGDPKLHPFAEARIGNERILFYPYAWVMVIQPDDTWQIARID